jgi:transcriptional regulator with XRE-family HTH domain
MSGYPDIRIKWLIEIMDTKTILVALNTRRWELDMPINEVARLSGISISTVRKLFSSKLRSPSFDVICKISQILGINISLREKSAVVMKKLAAQDAANKIIKMTQETSALESQAVGLSTVKLLRQELEAKKK